MKYFLISLLLLIFNSSEKNAKLSLSIENINKVKGTIEIGVFNTSHNFLEEGTAYKTYSIPVESASETVIIDDLPNGNYAISIYHDENADGECNLNFLGIPKEPYGFSNNIKPKFSAPSFKDCSFSFTEDRDIKINLID